jgi:U3 small nucleolar RNA-associated protein 18
MAKHPRKRQKTSKTSGNSHETTSSRLKEERLAMIMDDENKDDEERRLESLLFGVKYRPRDGGKVKDSDESGDQEGDESSEEEDGEGGGMRHLLDQDVCLLFSHFEFINFFFFGAHALRLNFVVILY